MELTEAVTKIEQATGFGRHPAAMRERRWKAFCVSYGDLIDILNIANRGVETLRVPVIPDLPKDAVVIDASPDPMARSFVIVIEHESFASVPEGLTPPRMAAHWEIVPIARASVDRVLHKLPESIRAGACASLDHGANPGSEDASSLQMHISHRTCGRAPSAGDLAPNCTIGSDGHATFGNSLVALYRTERLAKGHREAPIIADPFAKDWSEEKPSAQAPAGDAFISALSINVDQYFLEQIGWARSMVLRGVRYTKDGGHLQFAEEFRVEGIGPSFIRFRFPPGRSNVDVGDWFVIEFMSANFGSCEMRGGPWRVVCISCDGGPGFIYLVHDNETNPFEAGEIVSFTEYTRRLSPNSGFPDDVTEDAPEPTAPHAPRKIEFRKWL